MAKQIGIHQIRGKVGERSYYKTKGVDAGISRSINQGLSARVKTDEAFANTRLNNAEFKNANAIASVAFRSVPNRKRGMMVNFAVAEMTKVALEAIKQGTGSWGARRPSVEFDALVVNMLEEHAKSGAYNGEYGVITATPLLNNGSCTIDISMDEQVVSGLISEGINGIVCVPMKSLAGEILVDSLPRLFAGSAFGTPTPITFQQGDSVDESLSISVATPASVGMSQSGFEFAQQDTNHGFWAVVALLPFRREGANQYTLQEKCTYVALPLGQIPE